MIEITLDFEPRRYDQLRGLAASWILATETRKKILLPLKRAVSDEENPQLLSWMVEAIAPVEQEKKQVERELVQEWKLQPLYEWQQGIMGLGEHSCALTVALMGGDPYVAYPLRRVGPKKQSRWVEEEPYVRTLGQLRAYCGYGDPERKRTTDMSQPDLLRLGKPILKARLRLIAENLLKAKSDPYADYYYQSRELYKDAVHESPCRGRGTCGLDAGTPWRPGHQHAAALRYVVKRFLHDIYEQAQELHEADRW